MTDSEKAKPLSVSLYHDEWGEGEKKEIRSLNLVLEADGTIQIAGIDAGPFVEEMQGDWDYEYWLTIPPSAIPKLAFALLKKIYTGKSGAEVALQDFCKEHDIGHEFSVYI